MRSIGLFICLFLLSTSISAVTDEDVLFFPVRQLRQSRAVILIIEPDTGLIIDASNGALAFYDYPDLIGRNINTINTLSPEEITHEMSHAHSENRSFFRFEHRIAGGSIRAVEVNSYPMQYKGKTVLLSRIRDISDSKKQEKVLNILYVLIAGSLVVFLMILGVLLLMLHRSRHILQQHLSEKETLLKEVHHRIKNNLSSVTGLLKLHLDSATNEEVRQGITDALSRVESMRQLYQKLLLTDTYRTLSARIYLGELVSSIVSIFPDKDAITIETDVEDIDLDTRLLFPIGIIINELFTNAMKYAFEGTGCGIITLELKRSASGLHLMIGDNGCGLPDSFDQAHTPGYGAMLVAMMVKQLRGTLRIETGAGVRWIIEIPYVQSPEFMPLRKPL